MRWCERRNKNQQVLNKNAKNAIKFGVQLFQGSIPIAELKKISYFVSKHVRSARQNLFQTHLQLQNNSHTIILTCINEQTRKVIEYYRIDGLIIYRPLYFRFILILTKVSFSGN